MPSRRSFLKTVPLGSCAIALEGAAALSAQPFVKSEEVQLQLDPEPAGVLAPLDHVRVKSPVPGQIQVRDGNHHVYFETMTAGECEIVLGGALGTHSVSLIAGNGACLGMRTLRVDCTTVIEDEGGAMGDLLKDLYWTMTADGPVTAMRYKGQVFTCWDTWLMDNTNTLKGMKYFWPEVTSNVEFYTASQREDGMVWENFEARTPVETDWERRFAYGDFARPAEDGWLLLRRAPVENHVEAYLLESIYLSWKATGDTPWMAARLDAAIKAVQYATSDPYRWSTKYKLLKRGFTIDTWDFLCASEAQLVGGDVMCVDLKKTHFGVFFGDNAHMIAGLRWLSEMLNVVGRQEEATAHAALAGDLEGRLKALSWNGEFFVHWLPEDPAIRLDVGVDITRQVALSNAYSLNRGVSQQQCKAILKTYRRIRREMPPDSPGEFYAIYPPFERGFASEDVKWEYMNGGVMSCTAGELAWGAFDHGFEEYGVDILKRYKAIAARHHGYVPGILRGNPPRGPKRSLTSIDLREVANVDLGPGTAEVPGWMGEPDNDLRNMPTGQQQFRGVAFDVIEPSSNGRRACLALSSANGFKREATIEVDRTCGSFYLLHAKGGDDLVGKLTVRYADGTSHWEYIQAGVNVGHWWGPSDSQFKYRYGPGGPERMQVAWRGANQRFGNVGVYVVGFEHPHPDKTVASLHFEALDTDAKWMVLAVTLSDAPMYLPPWNDVSAGMPNNWGAAALTSALIEGLAGVKDTGAAFSKVRVAPRWHASGTHFAKVSVRYPASQGYVRYHYRMDAAKGLIGLDVTGCAEQYEIALLLPEGKVAQRASLNGKEVPLRTEAIESSHYCLLDASGVAVHHIELEVG